MSSIRLLDVGISAVGLLVAVPVMAAVAGVIALTDGRPILFRQRRVTRDGRLFTLVKFRTMTNMHDADGDLLPDAARTTPVGRALRAVRLDELPQLWHILTGDMALIGPRPLLPETIVAAGKLGQARCAVRPGLTGWAQVNGNTLLSDADKMALDLWYIDHRSLSLDINILWRTVLVALTGERTDPASIRRAYESGARWRS